MSILGMRNNNGEPFLSELKKQASFFLREKIKNARLALTDVTPAQLLVEEATSGNPGVPDTRILKIISRAAFEVDDYFRIVDILHRRLEKFDRKNWRVSYKALIVLEHLLTHGPGSASEEFQTDKNVIEEIGTFQHIDEKGFNWGLNLWMKSERILNLLGNGSLLKEERDKARKVTRGIEGFGSFSDRTDSGQGVSGDSSLKAYERSNSQFNDQGNQADKTMYHLSPQKNFNGLKIVGSVKTRTNTKENVAPKTKQLREDWDEWDFAGESNALLPEKKADYKTSSSSLDQDHPFNEYNHSSSVSLLSASRDQLLQAF